MKNYDKSVQFFAEAKQVMVGGVNSPVRAFRSVGGNPIYMERGLGARVWDIDGNEYVDYLASWGPLILGHAHPTVVGAIKDYAELGTSFGTPTVIETQMASKVCEIVPSIEMVRMVNSGTEATMSALRLARGYTGREKVIKFIGSYHGHGDSFLIKVGSGSALLGMPDSLGVPEQLAKNTIALPYNNIEAVQEAFRLIGEEVAAVIVEPIAGNMGVVPPLPGFLQGLREITEQYGALLIFDEVMTGFRVDYHCAQGLYDIQPDLTTLGKVIGGGLPVGAYGGKREIMEYVAPLGPVYQAGTLSGNPLAMVAGYTTLVELGREDVYEDLERKSDRLEQGFKANAQKVGVPITINRVGSLMGYFFNEGPVTHFEEAKSSNSEQFNSYFHAMIEQGIYIAPSPFEGMFISTAHTDEDIERTIEANLNALRKL